VSTDEERERKTAEWLEQNLTLDRRGRVVMRPELRTPVLTGLGLGVLNAAAWAVSGVAMVLAVGLLGGGVVTGVCLVVGLVVWTVGWATGPRGSLTERNQARRAGAAILKVAFAGFMMLFALFGIYVVLSMLGLHNP
jgi:hypothetical protein